MGCFSGVEQTWASQLDVGRTHIATKGTVQSGLVLNLDAGASSSYSGSSSDENLLTYSTPPGANWSTYATEGSATVTNNNQTAPDGTTTAARVVTSGTTSGINLVVGVIATMPTATTYTGSVYLRGAVGGEVVYIMIEDNYTWTVSAACTLTTSWQRFSVTGSRGTNASYFVIGGWGGYTPSTPACTYYFWGAQVQRSSTAGLYYATTGTARLGGTTWNDLSVGTGALQIYNTTNSYGTVKSTGTRTDANASSLVLAIPMDGANNGTTFTDESANIRGSGTAKSITPTSAITSTAQSKFYGSSGSFNGTTSKLSTAGTSDFQFGTGNFTVEGWFYQTADNTYPTALEIGSHPASTGILFITRTGGNACIYSGGFYGTAATTLNTWNHIAWIRNSGRLLIFVNGILLSDVAFTNNLTDLTNGVTIGVPGVPGAAYYFPGYLQDFRIYKGLAKYTSNFVPSGNPNNGTLVGSPTYNDGYGTVKGTGTRTDANASSLVLAIPMDGANNGTTFTDESANIKGSGTAKSITRNGDTKTLTAVSKFYGSSGFFDGTGDYLNLGTSSDYLFGTGDFTIEGWFYLTSDSTRQDLMGNYTDATTGWGVQTGYGVAGQIGFYYGNSVILDSAARVWSPNSWTHFAITRSGTSLKLFVNGVNTTTTTNSTNISTTSYNTLLGAVTSISGGSPFLFCTGYLQDFRIYKGLAKYTSNFVPSGNPNTTPTGAFPIYNTKDTGGSLTFNGSSQYVNTPYTNLLNMGTQLSICAFVKINNLSVDGPIFSSLDLQSSYAKGYSLRYQPTSIYGLSANRLMFQFGHDSFQWNVYGSTGISITDNNYHFISITASNLDTTSHTITFYIDGNSVSGTFWTEGFKRPILYSTNTSTLRVAGTYTASYPSYDTGYLNGRIPNLQVYNRALSASEITQNYNALKGRYV